MKIALRARIAAAMRPNHDPSDNPALAPDGPIGTPHCSPPIPLPRPALDWQEHISRSAMIELYWRAHPRFLFFKTIAANAAVLDVGCGDGGLALWRDYLPPNRSDLRLFGVDLAPGAHTSLYAGVQRANLDTDALGFEGQRFDAVIASHVLEHLQDPVSQLRRWAERLSDAGRIYVEVPSPASKALPRREEFRKAGWPMMISNFFDDGTHRETLSLAQLEAAAKSVGLVVEASGVIGNPLLADALIWRGVTRNDEECLLYGYWARTGWAHYAVMHRQLF